MSPPTVLLVDGDPKSLKLMEVGLRRQGHNVVALNGAEAARNWPADTPPSLIVAASDLPGEDGLDLLAELRTRAGWEDTPSVVLTPERTPAVVSRGMELGAEEFLTRPVFVRELLARVQMVIDRRSRHEGAAARARSGALEELALVDLLTSLESENASGVVYLESGERRGRLFLRDGRVVESKVGSASGLAGAFRVFRWHGGSWTFDPREVTQRDRVGRPTTDLLADAMERAEVWSALWNQLPGDDPVMEVDFAGVAAKGGQLPSDAGRILRLFDGLRTASRVIDDSPFDELATLKAIVRMHVDGLLSAPPPPTEAADDEDDEEEEEEEEEEEAADGEAGLDAWLDEEEDEEDRTVTAASAPSPDVVVSPAVAEAEAAALARAAEIMQEAEEARAAAEKARFEAEAAREAAEEARRTAEARIAAPETTPPDIDIEPLAAEVADPAASGDEGSGTVSVEETPEEGTAGVALQAGDEQPVGSVTVEEEDPAVEPAPAVDVAEAILGDEDWAGGDAESPVPEAPERVDGWGDEEEDVDEADGEVVRLDTSAIIETSSAALAAPKTDVEESPERPLADDEKNLSDWEAEATFADEEEEEEPPPPKAPPPAEEPAAEEKEEGESWSDLGDVDMATLDSSAIDSMVAEAAEGAAPVELGVEGLGEVASLDGLEGFDDFEEGGAGPTAEQETLPGPDADDPGPGPDADDAGSGTDPEGAEAGGGKFDWAAELDADDSVPAMTPMPPAEVKAANDELEAFGWGDDSAEEKEDDLDWGDALDGSSDDVDDWETVPDVSASTDGDTAPAAPGAGDPFATPAPPPTAVEVETVSTGSFGDEADEWEQALAEGDEFYEDEAPPPLEEAELGDLSLDLDGSADLEFGSAGAGGNLADALPDPDAGPAKEEREDSGPIDLSKFASRKHDQIKDDAGTSVWFKLTMFLMLSLGGLAAGAYFYIDAQQAPEPLQSPAGSAQPLPPRVDDPAYPLGLKEPKVAKVAPVAKPLPPPIGEGDDADGDAPPIPIDIAKEATGAAVLDDLPPADSVAAQLAMRKQGAALPPDKASRKLHAKHFKRAEKLRKRGKLDAAVAEYTQAMAHRPGHVPTLLGLGNAYFDLGRAGDARGVLAQAVKASPKNGKAWLVYGMVLQEEDDTNSAIKAYRRFLEFEPEDKYAGEVKSILQRLETE